MLRSSSAIAASQRIRGQPMRSPKTEKYVYSVFRLVTRQSQLRLPRDCQVGCAHRYHAPRTVHRHVIPHHAAVGPAHA
jgi:hypothetical protein